MCKCGGPWPALQSPPWDAPWWPNGTGNRMSQQTTIRKLAELVNTPVEKLLEQLAEAGMSFSGPDQVVTSIEKVKLLGFLKRAHGKAEPAGDVGEAPKTITLNRSRKQGLAVR